MSKADNHSQERRGCERTDEHRPHQWGPNAGAFGGNWCPGITSANLDNLAAAIAMGLASDLHDTTDMLLANYAEQVAELEFRLDRVRAIVDDADVIDRRTRNLLMTALNGRLPARVDATA